MNIPTHIANRIYDILVEHAGASDGETGRHSFLYHFCTRVQSGRPDGFMFGGIFGMAGKFWWNNDRFYVSGHSRGDKSFGTIDDAGLAREAEIIEPINALLAPLYREFEEYRLMRGMLEVIPAFQQHQGSVTDQLRLLVPIANKLGLQDAADSIQSLLDTSDKLRRERLAAATMEERSD